MQRQRQELSIAVKQLTDNSNSLYQQISQSASTSLQKKRLDEAKLWVETDLDKSKLIHPRPDYSMLMFIICFRT